MKQYLDLLRYILNCRERKPTRAILRSTGEKIDAFSVFGYQMRFDLDAGFPAVTTKKLAFNAVVHELLWFLSGSTNVAGLRKNNVTIWDEWADEKGELGPIYGKQWRRWEAPDGREIDQIAYVLKGIAAVKKDPSASVGRRLILTAWNPADLEKMSVPACHTLAQFSVTEDRLSCQLYQRSADSFLGVPFNIASYALLTHLIAHVSGLEVGEFIHTFGDVHIYTNHLEQVEEQLRREPYPLPRLTIDPSVRNLEQIERRHIELHDYRYHPALKGEIAVQGQLMRVSLIAALDRRGLIGDAGSLPWHLPKDLRRFREITWGKPIIMGRKTHESIGKALPGRLNIVLTQNAEYRAAGCQVARSFSEALSLAEEYLRNTGGDEVMVIGGATVYAEAIERWDRCYLTVVDGPFTGNTFFPIRTLLQQHWRPLREPEIHAADGKNPHRHSFHIIERVRDAAHSLPAREVLPLAHSDTVLGLDLPAILARGTLGS